MRNLWRGFVDLQGMFAIVCDTGTCKMQIYFKMFFFPCHSKEKQ